jgi:hypothetical protein
MTKEDWTRSRYNHALSTAIKRVETGLNSKAGAYRLGNTDKRNMTHSMAPSLLECQPQRCIQFPQN